MSPESQQQLKKELAKQAMRRWRTCPIHDLEDACDIFNGALILLIRRYALNLA